MSESTKQHYAMLLGLGEDWDVADVHFSLERKKIEISLVFKGKTLVCPECGIEGKRYDFVPERSWRHLDVMQFETIITAKTPRIGCKTCGVKIVAVPWAEKSSRFTLLFEEFCIDILQACRSVKAASELLRLDWKSVQAIIERAVIRGLVDRELDDIEHLSLDEKSTKKGHNYMTVLTDLNNHRIIDVVKGHDEASTDWIWAPFTDEQRERVKAVACDMWQAFVNSITSNLPNAEIVHDKFHVKKKLTEAVDSVRKQEHKALLKSSKELTGKPESVLTGTKYLWLKNEDNLTESQELRFSSIREINLKTGRAWALKESFDDFWNYRYAGNALKYFKNWFGWARRSQLEPIKSAALTLKRRLDQLLTYFRYRITSGASEGFNSAIESLKLNAKGFRNFRNFRFRVLFFHGKLRLKPSEITH
jgi:transposase